MSGAAAVVGVGGGGCLMAVVQSVTSSGLGGVVFGMSENAGSGFSGRFRRRGSFPVRTSAGWSLEVAGWSPKVAGWSPEDR